MGDSRSLTARGRFRAPSVDRVVPVDQVQMLFLTVSTLIVPPGPNFQA
jgi:hypothetical protein